MKVLLVRPFYHIDWYDWPYYLIEPLGLEYIASMIKGEHEVRILDFIGEYWYEHSPINNNTMMHIGASVKETQRRIKSYSPDIVGISSLFYTQSQCAYKVADITKEVDNDISVVMGGGHPSAFPIQTLKECGSIDFVVHGEGELIFKNLINNISTPEKVLGIAYKKNGRYFQNEPQPPIDMLDEIPFPSRDLVPYKNYAKTAAIQFRYGALREAARCLVNIPIIDQAYYRLYNAILHRLHKRIRLPAGSIISSRGCPLNCYFCAIHNVWGKKYRMRSAENVLEEITLLHEKYHMNHISIQDDNFTVSKKRTIDICKGILEHGLDITLNTPSGVYLPSLDKEVLEWMKKAGFYELYFGIESGNQNTLDKIINKRLDLDKVREVVSVCKEVGIKTGGFFVLGIPGETLDAMEDTVNFAISSNLEVARLYVCQPYPGSPLFSDCLKNNYFIKEITPDDLKIFGDKSFIKTTDFTPEDVARVVTEGREKLRKSGRLNMPVVEKK
ncbi:MAG: radical SAM protein [Candidatus Methanoperedens sp.]|nr:radical SAM protein [Candidatus Methanoperedens sp.]